MEEMAFFKELKRVQMLLLQIRVCLEKGDESGRKHPFGGHSHDDVHLQKTACTTQGKSSNQGTSLDFGSTAVSTWLCATGGHCS